MGSRLPTLVNMKWAILTLALSLISAAFGGPITADLGESQFPAMPSALDYLTPASNVVHLPATSLDQELPQSSTSGGWTLYDIWNSFLPSIMPGNMQGDAPLLGVDDNGGSGSFLASTFMTFALILQFAFIRRQSIGDFLILNGICGLYSFAVFLLKHRTQPKVAGEC